MLRIDNQKAEFALSLLAMARNMLKEGQTDMAIVALDMAESALKNSLEPSRAPKGKARDEASVDRRRRRQLAKAAASGGRAA